MAENEAKEVKESAPEEKKTASSEAPNVEVPTPGQAPAGQKPQVPQFESGKVYVLGYNRHEVKKQQGRVHPLLFSNFLKSVISDGFDILNVYTIGEEVTLVVKKQ